VWSTAAAIIAYRSLISLEVCKDTTAEVGSSHHEVDVDLQRSGSFDRGGGMSCDSTC
jgi:hypothetical protein